LAQSVAVPIQARLSITSPNKGEIQYPAVLLPNGEVTDYSYDNVRVVVGVRFKFEVTYSKGGPWHDVTQATQFSSRPESSSLAWTTFVLGQEGGSFTIFGRYTQGGVTVTDSLVIKPRLFKAPRFYNAGSAQAALIPQVESLVADVSVWANGAGLSDSAHQTVLAHVERLRVYTRLWWSGKLSQATSRLGDHLAAGNAPMGLLIRLSHIMLQLQQAGVMQLWDNGVFVQVQHQGNPYPAWLPAIDVLFAVSPPIMVYWFGL